MSGRAIDKVVILARGLGTRMRRADEGAGLTKDEAAVADQGLKAMIPIGRPFLDYVLSALADAGYRRVCLVIGPEHQKVRDYYAQVQPRRVQVSYAIQQQPRGTADAVAAAEEFAAADTVTVINSDNYYPISALRALRVDCPGSGLVAFSRQSLLNGNIQADRIQKFALIQTDGDGHMVRIVEKPTAEQVEALGEPLRASMNCWRFTPAIFQACKSIKPSARGELELPDAVQYTMSSGEVYTVLDCDEPLLDLSSRGDIASVKERLSSGKVEL
jgi:dTDP-glucose pyrophosphorylase